MVKTDGDTVGHPSDGDGAFRVQVDDVDQHLTFRRDAGKNFAADAVLGPEWGHYVVAYDAAADTLSWYANGELDSSYANVTFNPDTNGQALRLGRDPFANLSLDEVAVYQRALSAAEVAEHHTRLSRMLLK
jgi:hypothetical protein